MQDGISYCCTAEVVFVKQWGSCMLSPSKCLNKPPGNGCSLPSLLCVIGRMHSKKEKKSYVTLNTGFGIKSHCEFYIFHTFMSCYICVVLVILQLCIKFSNEGGSWNHRLCKVGRGHCGSPLFNS